MGDVKRYENHKPTSLDERYKGMLLAPETGEWVRYEDVQARIADQADDLKAAAEAQRLGLEERDRLRERIESMDGQIRLLVSIQAEKDERIAELEREVESGAEALGEWIRTYSALRQAIKELADGWEAKAPDIAARVRKLLGGVNE